MLVFNEGVPRAGKSYDAVKNHILPAIKKGRRVFARLNGLKHDLIASYLGLQESVVRDLLVHVPTDEVHRLFVARKDEAGHWVIPDTLKDALIIIDEVHGFYPADGRRMKAEHEEFFALIGQNGGDVLIMTQWIKRTHPAVRARIERKNVFQKLTAVGLKGRYQVTYWHTVSPDKYERVGSKTFAYDPAIFPLYDGYAPGADNVEVYDEGGTNIWKGMLPRAVVMLVIGGFGVWAFIGFFVRGDGDGGMLPAEHQASHNVPAVGDVFQPDFNGVMPGLPEFSTVPPEPDPVASLTPGQAYVHGLADLGRVRLAGRLQFAGVDRFVVEWVDSGGNAVERLDDRQLAALDVTATVSVAGVTLDTGAGSIVVTHWPLAQAIREPEARTYRVDGDDGGYGRTSSSATGVSLRDMGIGGSSDGFDGVARYGGFRE